MASWQDGYITDIPYTAGFYRELAPSYLHLLCVLLGVRPPRIGRDYAYCELACGQGLGTLVLAAGNPAGRFVGVDFNPAQIAKAQEIAERAGLRNVAFREQSFAAMAGEPAAAEKFDLIVLHGIYSWVSGENRAHIVRILNDRLKPGGLVYVSYNCMPGWAPFVPVQRLMREYVATRAGRSDASVVAAIEFARKMADKGARYFKANESVTRTLGRLEGKDRVYLAHEYLNEHWEALYHIDVARQMQEARLDYVGSATVSDNVVALNAPREVADLMTDLSPGLAETVKDFSVNRQFRRDLYVRGPVRLSGAQFVEELNRIRFVLTVPPDKVTLKLATAAGELDGNDRLLRPLLDALSADSATFRDLAAAVAASSDAQPWQVAQALSLLVESGQAHPMLEAASTGTSAQALNQALLDDAPLDESMQFLCAAAIGSGAFVPNAEQLILRTLRETPQAPAAELAASVWRSFKAQNKRLVRDGQRIEDETSNLTELQARIEEFIARRLPLLRDLGVAS